MEQGLSAVVAASSWPVGDVARGGLACCGEEGHAWRGSAVEARPGARRVGSGAARAKHVLCSCSGRARDMLDVMPEHARGRG